METLTNFYETPSVNTKTDKQQMKQVRAVLDDLHIAAYPPEKLRGLRTLGLYQHEIATFVGAKSEEMRQWARGAELTNEQARLLEGACTISTWLLRKHYATEPVVEELREYHDELCYGTIIRSFAKDDQLASQLVLGLVTAPATEVLSQAA
jgi:hypothetical protein